MLPTTAHNAHADDRARSPRALGMAAVLFAAITGLSLTACNTMEGAGEDIEAAGEGIEDAAND